MKCTICGFDNVDGALFCKTCGSSMPQNESENEKNSSQNQPNGTSNNYSEETSQNMSSNNTDIAYPWGEYPPEQTQFSHNGNQQPSSANPQPTTQVSPVKKAETVPVHTPVAPHMVTPKAKKSSKGLIAVIIILVIALVASVCTVSYLLLSKNDEDDISSSNKTHSVKKKDDNKDKEDPSNNDDDDNGPELVEESDVSSDADDPDKPDIIINPDADSGKNKKHGSDTEHYYVAVKEDITWLEAKYAAESMGGYLVCINDYNEFVEVYKIAQENQITSCWLGAELGSNYSWYDVRYLDGTYVPSSASMWHDSEPSYKDEKLNIYENYLMLSYWGDTIGWGLNDSPNNAADILGSGKIGYIVEFGYN